MAAARHGRGRPSPSRIPVSAAPHMRYGRGAPKSRRSAREERRRLRHVRARSSPSSTAFLASTRTAHGKNMGAPPRQRRGDRNGPAPYSRECAWPTSGTTRAGSAYPLPPLARRVPGSASSSSPGALFRSPLASDPARGGETLDQVKARRGTVALSHRVIDLVTRRGRQPSPETLFALIEEFFDAGDATPKLSPDGNESPAGRSAPAPAILNQDAGPRAAPAFVEWLMGLDQGGSPIRVWG